MSVACDAHWRVCGTRVESIVALFELAESFMRRVESAAEIVCDDAAARSLGASPAVHLQG